MSISTKQNNNSEDEFESADEGEAIGNLKEIKASQAVTDGWDNWNIDEESPITMSSDKIYKQSSISSLSSSSPSKIGSSLSQNGSDEDERNYSMDQQHIHRKKLRKKHHTEPYQVKEAHTSIKQPFHSTEHSHNCNLPTDETKHNAKDAHYLLDRLSAQSPTQAPNWHKPWSNIGSFLSNAKQSVTTLTNTVSEGFNAVIETVEAGLGAPDPQQLAEMNRMALKIKGETSESEDEPELSNVQTEKVDLVTNQDGWLNALSLEKLTDTGMKMVSGSLDVLETVGKKTFDVIHDVNPDIKGTRRLLNKQDGPTLSEIIREAQQEKATKSLSQKSEPVTFLQLLEKHHGLVHFEALELLSNQSAITLQTLSYANVDLIEEISKYFLINDDDDLTLNSLSMNDDNEQDIPSLDVLSQRFTAYQTQLRSTVPVDKLLEVYESANEFIKEWEWKDTEVDQKTLFDEAIHSLAILCASIIEYYHKTAELFLVGCKSLTSFSIDVELLAIYRKQQQDFSHMLAGIPNLFAKHMKYISTLSTNDTNDTSKKCDSKYRQMLLNQMFIQSSTSQSYASDAYLLLKPIVSQSIVYHRSTTR